MRGAWEISDNKEACQHARGNITDILRLALGSRGSYNLHSTLRSWLQNGQLNCVGTLWIICVYPHRTPSWSQTLEVNAIKHHAPQRAIMFLHIHNTLIVVDFSACHLRSWAIWDYTTIRAEYTRNQVWKSSQGSTLMDIQGFPKTIKLPPSVSKYAAYIVSKIRWHHDGRMLRKLIFQYNGQIRHGSWNRLVHEHSALVKHTIYKKKNNILIPKHELWYH